MDVELGGKPSECGVSGSQVKVFKEIVIAVSDVANVSNQVRLENGLWI